MMRSINKKLFIALATTCFVTWGLMVCFYTPNDCQKEILEITQRHFMLGREDQKMNVPRIPELNSDAIYVTAKQGMEDKKTNIISSTLMEERRRLVTSECSKLPEKSPPINIILYNAKYKFYYCPVEKIASTFWRRFSYQLNNTDPVRSPFDVPIRKGVVGTNSLHIPNKQRNDREMDKILGESTKLLFVRDPYSRIFSAYVDKLLPPNPTFNKRWAQPAILLHRPSHRVDMSSNCGYDVTFEEFVNYVIDVLAKKDLHTMPINKMCRPCAVGYTVIGKMETFMDDASLLFDYLHLNTKYLRMETIKQETIYDAIADSGTDALSTRWLSSSLKCVTKETVLQRVWRKTQIRGLVSWRENMNLSFSEIDLMTSEQFVKVLTAAHERSTDKGELKIQKLQAVKEAFSKLSKSLINRITRIYKDDFKLFGFDEYPAWLKSLETGGSFIDTKSLDYSQHWDLSPVLSEKT